ncbi:hypothetical protein DFR50_13624 [Roseiarcus fermentans]|uniref:Uncharacterized protein n=2 Tax=Roseiarcus fermentans TaxID=1473586 RepID=A0A366EUG4_9HYPH|nr:hypothetical protein DFR50_13624 [Roseiarcus fermentans]
MTGSVRWFSAALIAGALASAAEAETAPASATPTIHARARHHHKAQVAQQPEGRQITVHKSAQKPTPSWLTLGTDAPVGTGNNYVTSTFDQPTPIQGTFSGWRGQERIIPQYGVPGATLFNF